MSDHCILDYAQQPPRFRCLRCSDEHWIMLPMPVTQLVRLSDEFDALHSNCRHNPTP